MFRPSPSATTGVVPSMNSIRVPSRENETEYASFPLDIWRTAPLLGLTSYNPTFPTNTTRSPPVAANVGASALAPETRASDRASTTVERARTG